MSDDRKRAVEEQLRETEAKYQALVEQIPAILYVDLPDEKDTTIYVSPQIEQILGLTPEDWIKDSANLWTKNLHPEDRKRVLEDYSKFLKTGQPEVQEYRMIRPDGRVVWIHDRSTIVRDEDGNALLVQGVMFDVTEQKEAGAIISTQIELLKKVDAIGRDFTDLVLQGAGLKRILQRLSDIVGNPVVLEDTAHQLLEYSTYTNSVDDVLAAWDRHSRAGHDEAARGVAQLHEGDPPCAWIPVWLRNDIWGRVHVLEIDRPLDDVDVLALDRAAAAVGLALHSERHTAHLADHARGALISDIWEGRYGSAQEVIRRARGLGAELEGRRLATVVVEPRDLSEFAARAGQGEGERQRLRAGIVRETRAAMSEAGMTGLSAIVGDRVLAIVAYSDGPDSVDKVADLACRRIAEELDGLAVVVGVSAEADIDSLRRAFEQAAEAASFGVRTSRGPGVHHFGDLGVHHLLLHLSEGPELARFVEAELKPLLEHDAKSSSPLLPTLRAYLDCGGRKAEAARALHVERRSLYYRLERMERLLKRNLEDPETRIRLEIALRGLDLLRQRSALPEA